MSVVLNGAFVGGLIAGYAGLSSCAATAACVIISVKNQFPDQVKVRDTSQLISGVFNVLQKLLKCFNGTIISILFLVFLSPYSMFSSFSCFAFNVFPVILLLYLKNLEFVIGSAL